MLFTLRPLPGCSNIATDAADFEALSDANQAEHHDLWDFNSTSVLYIHGYATPLEKWLTVLGPSHACTSKHCCSRGTVRVVGRPHCILACRSPRRCTRGICPSWAARPATADEALALADQASHGVFLVMPHPSPLIRGPSESGLLGRARRLPTPPCFVFLLLLLYGVYSMFISVTKGYAALACARSLV